MLFGTWVKKIGKGILEFEDNLECPICLEKQLCILYPRCSNKICI